MHGSTTGLVVRHGICMRKYLIVKNVLCRARVFGRVVSKRSICGEEFNKGGDLNINIEGVCLAFGDRLRLRDSNYYSQSYTSSRSNLLKIQTLILFTKVVQALITINSDTSFLLNIIVFVNKFGFVTE